MHRVLLVETGSDTFCKFGIGKSGHNLSKVVYVSGSLAYLSVCTKSNLRGGQHRW
jgi:hypothetical protein